MARVQLRSSGEETEVHLLSVTHVRKMAKCKGVIIFQGTT